MKKYRIVATPTCSGLLYYVQEKKWFGWGIPGANSLICPYPAGRMSYKYFDTLDEVNESIERAKFSAEKDYVIKEVD